MATSSRLASLAAVLAGAVLASGCQWPQTSMKPQPPAARVPLADAPCADRLGEICTRLLLYYSAHREMPARLEDLASVGKGPMPPLLCPVSGQPYIYSPVGVGVPGTTKRLLVYDPLPSHAGTRWVIAVEPTPPGKPLVPQVLRMSPKASSPDAAPR